MLFESMESTGILPVFCPKNEAELNTFAEGVYNAGVRTVEITLRSEFALFAIDILKRRYPSLYVGAGTVMSRDLLRRAADVGADFLVSPGYTEALTDEAESLGIPFIPGCSTPTEIQNAFIRGLRILKFFPAELSGKTAALKLYASAFSQIRFIPTGGITTDNAAEYLKQPNVLACGGSFMIPRDALQRGDHAAVTAVTKGCMKEGTR